MTTFTIPSRAPRTFVVDLRLPLTVRERQKQVVPIP
jgi:hypothetical protein